MIRFSKQLLEKIVLEGQERWLYWGFLWLSSWFICLSWRLVRSLSSILQVVCY